MIARDYCGMEDVVYSEISYRLDKSNVLNYKVLPINV